MDMWIWVILALVLALVIIWFVLAGPGMDSVTAQHEHHGVEEPAPHPVVEAPAVSEAAGATADEVAPVESDARRVQHGVVHDVAESKPGRAVADAPEVAVEDVEPEPEPSDGQRGIPAAGAAAAGAVGLVGASSLGGRRVAEDDITDAAVEDAEPEPVAVAEPVQPVHTFEASAIDAAAQKLNVAQAEPEPVVEPEPEPVVEPEPVAPAHTFDASALDQATGKLAGAAGAAGLAGAGLAGVVAADHVEDDASAGEPEVLDATRVEAADVEADIEGDYVTEIDDADSPVEADIEGVYTTEMDEPEIDDGDLENEYESPKPRISGVPAREAAVDVEPAKPAHTFEAGALAAAAAGLAGAKLAGDEPKPEDDERTWWPAAKDEESGAAEQSAQSEPTEAEPIEVEPTETIEEVVAERDEPEVLAPTPKPASSDDEALGGGLAAGAKAQAAKPFIEPEPVAESASTWAPADDADVEQVWDGPFGPGSADANPDGSGPRGWAIKAARQTKVYLTPDIPVYAAAKANIWFVDEQRAIDAGFRRWDMPK